MWGHKYWVHNSTLSILKETLVSLSAGGNCNMVLVTNIYGEAAQLDETVGRDSLCDQAGVSPHGCRD